MEEPLEYVEVRKNLEWTWSWHGIKPVHLLYAVAPPVLLCGIILGRAAIRDTEAHAVLPCLVLATVCLVAVLTHQYGRPSDYLDRALARWHVPDHLSPFQEPVTPMRPFPVNQQDLR